ncbi:protein lava lamp isoform X5 [Prunus yedoensis var. nudiflora]|uniref:Protein lava lamp isoform X5 n=1 Tax=Prunus yedoensis var. nudiflora TaxID=2094558 RepID=A0A314UNG3_PRUYE|nr:protein lava lamp isoform X5 [Prunus yedoensis var. nudiflora]
MREVDEDGIKIPAQAGEAESQVELSELQSRGHEIATESENFHQVPGKEDSEVSFIMVEKPFSDGCVGGSPYLNLGREIFDDSSGL